MATDVIYKGSPYDSLCSLIKKILQNQSGPCEVLIIIPKQRDCREDFLKIMKEQGNFDWTVTNLDGERYR